MVPRAVKSVHTGDIRCHVPHGGEASIRPSQSLLLFCLQAPVITAQVLGKGGEDARLCAPLALQATH